MMMNSLVRVFKLGTCNCNSLVGIVRVVEWNVLPIREKVDACALEKTSFKARHQAATRGYTLYRQDRLGSRKGGVAIVVMKWLVYHPW